MSIPSKINPLGTIGLPDGYTRVEYLESTGTQCINTLFYLPPDVEAEAVLSFSELTTNATYLFGNYGSEISAYLLFGPMGSLGHFWAVDGAYSIGLDAPSPISFHEFFHLRIGLGQVFFNGLPMIEWARNNIYLDAAPRTLVLFARNHKNGYITEFSSGRIRSFVLRSGGRVLRNYQPCLSPTGVPGMFDLVQRQFFSNFGTGDFLYPTESSTYSLRRVLPDWGKLTENGIRRLYHAPKNYHGELYDYALENGYKPIVEPEKPEDGYWTPHWTETDEEIVLEWVETEPTSDEFGLPEES